MFVVLVSLCCVYGLKSINPVMYPRFTTKSTSLTLTDIGKALLISFCATPKVNLFDTTCITIVLYGFESWVISNDMEGKINSFETSCYHIMLNINRVDRVPNTTMYNLTETAPLVVRARTHQLKLIGHYHACLMMSLLKSLHHISQVLVKGNLNSNRLYSQNTSSACMEVWTAY